MNAVTIYCKTPNEKYELTDCQEGHWCQLSTFSLLPNGHQCFLQALHVWQGGDKYILMLVYVFIPVSCLLTLHKLLGCVHYGLWVPKYLSVIMVVCSNVRTMSWHNGLGQGWRSTLLCHVGTCLPTTCSHIPEKYNLLNMCKIFYVLLTEHPGMILVNNQLDAQFFMYVYFYPLHVSGSHVPIIRRIIVSMRHLVDV